MSEEKENEQSEYTSKKPTYNILEIVQDKINPETLEKMKKANEIQRALNQDGGFSKDYVKNNTLKEYFDVERPTKDVLHDIGQEVLWDALFSSALAAKNIGKIKKASPIYKRNKHDFNLLSEMMSSKAIGGKSPVESYGLSTMHAQAGMRNLSNIAKNIIIKNSAELLGKIGGVAGFGAFAKALANTNKALKFAEADWETLDDIFNYIEANKEMLPTDRYEEFMNAFADYSETTSKSEKINAAKTMADIAKANHLLDNYLGRDYKVYGDE